MRIAKIKTKDGAVEIHFEEYRDKEEKDVVFRCKEPTHQDFVSAMAALVKLAREILQLPADYRPQSMTVTGVSFSRSEETGVEGAVLTGQVELDTSNAPFCFNTPHLPFHQYSDTGEAPLMPEHGIKLLERLRKEAEAYIAGTKRAQLSLAV